MRTVRDILTAAREHRLFDKAGGSQLDWFEDDTDYLWSNAELVRYLDEARREYSRRRPIRDSQTAAVCEIAVPAGLQPVVSVDDRILAIDSARLRSQDVGLTKQYVNNALEDLEPDWRTYSGHPSRYVEDLDDYKIRILGTVSADDVLELIVRRTVLEDVPWPYITWSASAAVPQGTLVKPTTYNGHYYRATVGGTTSGTEPTWPTNGGVVVENDVEWTDQGLIGAGVVPEVPARHLPFLLDWMAHLAYQKHDSSDGSGTYRPDLADHYEEKFDRHVGSRVSIADEDNRRRTANLRSRTRTYYR